MTAGTLVLVVGPSGAGKDSVIDEARRHFAAAPRVVFPMRLITRPSGAGGEVYQALSSAQFDRLRRQGAFALCWSAHGLNYAIPAGIEADLQAGRTVVANVSRSVVGAARARYPGVVVVEITAPPAVLAARLARRGRESPAEIDERLERAAALDCEGALVIVNDGPLSRAAGQFIAVLEGTLAPASSTAELTA